MEISFDTGFNQVGLFCTRGSFPCPSPPPNKFSSQQIKKGETQNKIDLLATIIAKWAGVPGYILILGRRPEVISTGFFFFFKSSQEWILILGS